MTDYISREAALETINDILSPYGPKGDAISKTVAYCEIKNIPAADVRPVVTCEKCKYNNACLTQSFVEEASRFPFDRKTFFCSDAEAGMRGEAE